jgi:hypothetical protein
MDEPIRTKISINKNEPGWLDFKMTYISGNYEFPAALIKKARDQYVHPEDDV